MKPRTFIEKIPKFAISMAKLCAQAQLATMTENLPQPISDSIVPNILALNNAHSVELSWLDLDRLKSLLRQAFYARMIGSADAFLIAFDQGARYDSPNYVWFRQRYSR